MTDRIKSMAALLIAPFLVLTLALAATAVAAPAVKNAATIVPADVADPMFTRVALPPKGGGGCLKGTLGPIEMGGRIVCVTCPDKAVPVKSEKKYECLWCPPGYHGHVFIGAWMCYRCQTKDVAGMNAAQIGDRTWCVRCKPGTRWDPAQKRCRP
ncbi:MAG: hypothetical protein KJ621_00450 [Proteobacteria bacterium]|nr:hypothetical protein [Pseudomonadota bacterium]